MSSTRTAKDDSVYHQASHASSPEFERGLIGNLVARRAALLDSREDRELVWALHFLSHQAGGLELVARELLANYPKHIGTPAMLACGKTNEQSYTPAELAAIARQFPKHCGKELLSEDGCGDESKIDLFHKRRELSHLRESVELNEGTPETHRKIGLLINEIEKLKRLKTPAARPAARTAGELRQLCIEAGQGVLNLPKTDEFLLSDALADFCLKPSRNFDFVAPWYFAGLVDALRDYVLKWTAARTAFPETALGRIVADEFDYTMHGRCLTLLCGEARRGKSFAAKNCCLKNIGRARFVEVPPGNDDTSFYRALARGLGLGNFLKYKAIDIRERVESVLLSGDLLLVLDEAQRLWPECWQRYARPARINWLMMMVNAKVPILLVSTPQFLTGQKVAEKTGWNSAQLTGRIFNFKTLPGDLDESDLMAVCRSVLPEVEKKVLSHLATYARTSARYLSAVESIAMRARHLASRAGRQQCSTEDVRTAMLESVIPSDSALNSILEKSRVESSRGRLSRAELPATEASAVPPAPRIISPASKALSSAAVNRDSITEFTSPKS